MATSFPFSVHNGAPPPKQAEETWQLAPRSEALFHRGFDIQHWFGTERYQNSVSETYRLPNIGEHPNALALMIGNTRALWPPFMAAYRERPDLQTHPHPLQQFTREAVQVFADHLPVHHDVRFVFEPPPRRVAMQALCEASGFARLEACHLNVHPHWGPWFALRAVVVFDAPGPTPVDPPTGCSHCEDGCRPHLRVLQQPEITWTDLLAIRDGCPLGRDHRYSEGQIGYHYTKERRFLGPFGN